LPDSSSNEDPNANYTGWDLPEHPGLRAWIESLPPLTGESLYKVQIFRQDGSRDEVLLLMAHSEGDAFEEFDLMFLAAHNAAFGEEVERLLLWSPGDESARVNIAGFHIGLGR
jgi:hypothetical protein